VDRNRRRRNGRRNGAIRTRQHAVGIIRRIIFWEFDNYLRTRSTRAVRVARLRHRRPLQECPPVIFSLIPRAVSERGQGLQRRGGLEGLEGRFRSHRGGRAAIILAMTPQPHGRDRRPSDRSGNQCRAR
jgi:hypothetical protein